MCVRRPPRLAPTARHRHHVCCCRSSCVEAQQPARPQTMVLARKISMQGGTSRDDAKSHLEVEVEDAAVESEEQTDGTQRHRRRRKGRRRAQRIVTQQDKASKHEDAEGLKAFVLNYCLVLIFLVFPRTTNIVFTMLRPCRHVASPLPHGSEWLWNDYSIQVS